MTLINTLTANTQDLRAEFIEKTIAFANRFFENQKALAAQTIEEWYTNWDVEFTNAVIGYKEDGKTLEYRAQVDRKEYHKKNMYNMEKARTKAKNVVFDGLEKFVASEVRNAELHYEQSIAKLADRLQKKGLTDNDTFEIVSGKVKQNFEIIIKHGDTTTKAWTIIAEGPINRPHYRYLVK